MLIVQNAAQKGESFDQTERSVREMLLQIGRQTVDLFVVLYRPMATWSKGLRGDTALATQHR